MSYRPVATEAHGVMVEAQGIWNIRNVCVCSQTDHEGGPPVVIAAWISNHDALIEKIISSINPEQQKRYSLSGSDFSVHLFKDNDSRVLLCVTTKSHDFA